MQISIIAAVAQNNVIGINNSLIWHLPDDLKFFKQTTQGHHIIMGRKNYESIGRALPNRTNIVISRNPNYNAPNCIVVGSLQEAIQKVTADEQPFIIGGGQIYELALPITNTIYLTRVNTEPQGDTLFPELSKNEWILTGSIYHPSDEKHKYDFTFEKYIRK